MVSNVSINQNTRLDQCPHGMSPGACPICNPTKMGGGGKRKDEAIKKQVEKPVQKPVQNPNEWSYARCLAAWRRMQAQKADTEAQKLELQKLISPQEKAAKFIEAVSDKIQNAVQNIKNPYIQQVVQTLANITTTILRQIPKVVGFISEAGQKLAQMLQGAGEKLAAILGDIKNFVLRKFSEDIKKKAKKFIFSFFTIRESENDHDDETIEIVKSREIKKYIVKIFRKDKHKEDDSTKRIEESANNKYKEATAAAGKAD